MRTCPTKPGYLESFDRFRAGVVSIVDMPERTLDKLLGFLRQNGGQLSKRAREREFARLTEEEVARIEGLYAEAFGDAEPIR